jgi:hypothetical protein
MHDRSYHILSCKTSVQLALLLTLISPVSCIGFSTLEKLLYAELTKKSRTFLISLSYFFIFYAAIIPKLTLKVKKNFWATLKKFLDKVTAVRYNTPMKKYKKRPWTTDERRILASQYYQLDIDSVAMLLPGRTIQSIRNQVSYIRKRGYRFKT